MEINKSKALIYILTFAAYAWSGYGSNVLSNLKDAVISAESIFGDILDKVSDVVKNLKNVNKQIDATIDEECIFTCPNGVKPKPNKYHRPIPNGCGPSGMEVVQSEGMSLQDMTKCCNEHDICYGTCNRDKDKCDLDFKKCLYRICDKSYNSEPTSSKGCKLTAKVFHTATTALGCSFYLDAQKEACFCQGMKKDEL